MSSPALFSANPKTLQAPVTTTAAAITTNPGSASRANGGVSVKALAANTAIVYVGGSNLTTANGYPLAAGDAISLAVDDPSRVWAVAASGAQNVAVIYL